jgi:DnaJ-class molecular chaperone
MKGTGIMMKLMEWGSWRRGTAAERGREVAQGRVFSCAFCRGTGMLPGSKGIKCQVCRGEGHVEVDPPAIICAYCGGRGESNPRTNITCIVCRGKGVVPVKEPFTQCHQCRGTGVEANSKLPCLACRGKGVTLAVSA